MMKSLEGLKKLEYFYISGEEKLWNARLLARCLTKTRMETDILSSVKSGECKAKLDSDSEDKFFF